MCCSKCVSVDVSVGSVPCFVLWVNVSLRVSVHPAVHVCNSVCVLCAASLFGTRPGSGLLQSHIPPAPLCSVLQKIFAFSTTHNFSSSIATRCGSCGPCPHGNRGSSSRGSLLWRLPWELACCRPEGVGRVYVGQGSFKGSQQFPPRWPPGSSWGASPPGSCLASRPQHLAHRATRSRNRLLKVQKVPLLCEAPTQRVPEGWGLGCLESSRGRGKKVPTKGLVDVTILVSPVCWSKLGGDGEIEVARG